MIENHVVYRLAEQVLHEKLTLEKALQRVAKEAVLAQVDDKVIHELNRRAYTWGRQEPPRATVLAVLNCRVAELKGNNAMKGDCNSTLGWLYLRQDRLDLALQHHQKALGFLEPIPRARAAVARVRLEVGEIRMRQGDLEAATAEYQATLALALQLEHPQLEGDAQSNLGAIYLAQGQVERALAAFQTVLEISQRNNDEHGEAAALGNLGRVSRFLGRLTEAVCYHRRALRLGRQIGHQAGIGRHLGQLGSALLEKGDLDGAETYFIEALNIARQCGDRPNEQQRLDSLGNLYQAKAKRENDPLQSNQWLAMAQDYYQSALRIAGERDDPRGQARYLLHLGRVYRKLECLQKAQEYYTDALSLAREQNVSDTQWRVHYAWGELCDAQHQDQLAFDHYAAAIRIVEDQRDRLEIESRIKFWQERTLLYKRMVLCCLRLDKLWLALEYTERAKARYLADVLAKHKSLAKGTHVTVCTVLKALPAHTAVVVFNVTEAGTVIFIVTEHPNENGVGSPDDGWQQSSCVCVRARWLEDFDRDTLQRILIEVDDSGEAVGGYLVDYYDYVDYCNRKDRNEEVEYLKSEKWKATLERVCADLYKALLAPMHQELARLSIKRVVFMPNLGLSLLPLHACYQVNGTGRDYLLDHYEITYAPSFDVLRHCQEQANLELDDSFFAVANPEKADPQRNLVWAEAEVERIIEAGLFSRTRKLDSDPKNLATPEAVIVEASNYTFIHFACHGEFNLREPLSSTLWLAPKPRTLATEKSQLNPLTLKAILMGETRTTNNGITKTLGPLELPHTRLVVMSACETGLVDPGDLADEYIGLPAGFLLAGAPSIVSTLWMVRDISTALLMEHFYCHLKNGLDCRQGGSLSLAQALRRAQQWLRDQVTAKMVADVCQKRVEMLAQDDPAYAQLLGEQMRYELMPPDSHPFDHLRYWAPFILSGQ